jgi:hypothetical protein
MGRHSSSPQAKRYSMGTDTLDFRTAQKHVANYKQESKLLMQAQQEAMDCRDCEAFLQLGIDAFRWIIRADRVVRSAFYNGVAEYDHGLDGQIAVLCREWLTPCEYAEMWIAKQLERRYQISNLAEFHKCCEEMRAIVEAQGHSDGEPLPPSMIELRDKAIDEHLNGQTSEFV